MDDLVLYIFQEKGKEKEDSLYTFVLEERDEPPVIGITRVSKSVAADIEDFYKKVGEAVDAYIRNLGIGEYYTREGLHEKVEVADAEYQAKVGRLVEEVSGTLRHDFFPDPDDTDRGYAFWERFAELERDSAERVSPRHLLIASNDVHTPWWIMKSADGAEERLICEAFALSLSSLRMNRRKTASCPPPPVKISVITCPTLDLAFREDLPDINLETDTVTDLRNSGIAHFNLLSGRVEQQGRYGLDATRVTDAFRDGRIVIYHGHFTRSNDAMDNSTISVYKGNTKHSKKDIRIQMLEDELTDKDLVFSACESAGVHPSMNETFWEYLGGKGSTLVGTLYPILDKEARTFTNALSRELFKELHSWGESVRKARQAAADLAAEASRQAIEAVTEAQSKIDVAVTEAQKESAKKEKEEADRKKSAAVASSFFYRGAYCHFGLPWEMSPLFGAKRQLTVLVPQYLFGVYDLLKPEKVYASAVDTRYVSASEIRGILDEETELCARDNSRLMLAAIPSVLTAELLAEKPDEWVVLSPLVASLDDVRAVAINGDSLLDVAKAWENKTIAYKGPQLTASAFLEVLLSKRAIGIDQGQWKEIPTDCAPVVKAELTDIGLIVAREDLASGDSFPGVTNMSIDTALARCYDEDAQPDPEPIPRILWVTTRRCYDECGKHYIDEFMKRLGERITNEWDDGPFVDDPIPSRLRLYRPEDHATIESAIQLLVRFMADWTALGPALGENRPQLLREHFAK